MSTAERSDNVVTNIEQTGGPAEHGTQSQPETPVQRSPVERSPVSGRYLFVTGRLAEPALRSVLEPLSRRVGFEFDITVLKISVAALMHPEWVGKQLPSPDGFDRVILPGWCEGNLSPLEERFGVPFETGPKDLFDLPDHFGAQGREKPPLDRYDIDIIAEINHAPRLDPDELFAAADRYRLAGADIIDLGCIPGETWDEAADAVTLLRTLGFRVSIDSFNRAEVEPAVAAGAELVLSVNGSNVDWAADLNCEWVVIPDDPRDLDSLEPTIERMRSAGRSIRIDPILEPIGYGFAASLARYHEARTRWPKLPMMMGIGNVTELTEVDTAGVNMLLAAICQELHIESVLATQVINWGRSAVAEFDVARRLVRHAVSNNVLPKHIDSRLVMLRDPRVSPLGEEELHRMAGEIRDPNFRIFAERGELHLMNRNGYWRGRDPFALADEVLKSHPDLSASHAFYLGYELAKGVTALTLGKQYRQDEALRWGMLTVPEVSAIERRKQARTALPPEGNAGAEEKTGAEGNA